MSHQSEREVLGPSAVGLQLCLGARGVASGALRVSLVNKRCRLRCSLRNRGGGGLLFLRTSRADVLDEALHQAANGGNVITVLAATVREGEVFDVFVEV